MHWDLGVPRDPGGLGVPEGPRGPGGWAGAQSIKTLWIGIERGEGGKWSLIHIGLNLSRLA